jgi:hypothetical protein
MHRPRRTAADFDDDACDRVGDVGWKEIPALCYRVLDQDFDTEVQSTWFSTRHEYSTCSTVTYSYSVLCVESLKLPGSCQSKYGLSAGLSHHDLDGQTVLGKNDVPDRAEDELLW